MSAQTKMKYPIGVKMNAIKMKQEGFPISEIQKTFGIKSESQVYAWWYWYRDGELHRLEQHVGKQYSYGYGPEGSTREEVLLNQNKSIKA